MDVSDLRVGQSIRVRDELAEKMQKCFKDFLAEYGEERRTDSSSLKYLEDAIDLVKPERNTLFVNFEDFEKFDQQAADTLVEQYYRLFPYLCRGMCFCYMWMLLMLMVFV